MATLLRVHGVIRLPHVISECDGAGRDLGLKKSVLGTGCMVKRSLPGASQCLDNIGRLRPQAGGDCNSGVGEIPKSFQRSEEHTSELQSQSNLVCRLLLEKKKKATELDASTCEI